MTMTANGGKKSMARMASLFVQFRQNGTIDAYRTVIASTVVFFLLLTIVAPSFATVYAVDYASQAAAAVIMIPVVALVLVFQGRVNPCLTAGTVAG